MPSSKHGPIAATLFLFGIVTVLYSLFLFQQLRLGIGVAVSFFVVGLIVYYGDTARQIATRATIFVTLIYGVFTFQLPFAVVAACIVYLTAWVTGSDSPLDSPDTQVFPAKSNATKEADDV